MEKRNCYVYVIFRRDGSPCYVGVGTGKRWLRDVERSKHNPIFANIVRKSGELPRIKLRENISAQQAFEIEKALIAAIGRKPSGPLVNLTSGGEGVFGMDVESRAKISAAMLKRMSDPIEKQKASEWMKRRQNTPESRLRSREIMIELRCSNESVARARKGRKNSDSMRAAISAKAKVRMADTVVRERISKKLTGTTQSEETKQKKREAHLRYWNARREAGLSMHRPAKDEGARREKIRATMLRIKRGSSK